MQLTDGGFDTPSAPLEETGAADFKASALPADPKYTKRKYQIVHIIIKHVAYMNSYVTYIHRVLRFLCVACAFVYVFGHVTFPLRFFFFRLFTFA